MSEPHEAVQQMVAEARRLDNASEQYANAMATLLQGKLRKVSDGSVLAKLKKELASYNIHTGRWRA